jgi:hypothetical protein
MTAPRTPEQRARFIRSAASDLDVAPDLAERLLVLSEAARGHAGGAGPRRVRALLDCLLDDEVSRHGWWVARHEGEELWRLLLRDAEPPRDVGPAVLLGFALAGRGAAGPALEIVAAVVRPGEFRRSAIELAADLAEDAGRPAAAWSHVLRLGLGDQAEQWHALRCVMGCSERGPCARARLAGVAHARWLRRRVDRWLRRPWSGHGRPPDGAIAGYLAARRSVLPPGEAQLLELWSDVPAEPLVVHRTGPWEAVVSGPDGVPRLAGWDRAVPPAVTAGSTVVGTLLPTLVPAERLLVTTTTPPTW